MSITAKELAEKLHLSTAAVSMALNGKPGVSTKTRQLVVETAEKFGYDFSRIQAKNVTIGSICFAIYRKHGAIVSDTPFFSEVTEGITNGCKQEKYKLRIQYIYEDEDTLERQIEDIQYSDCVGMVLLGTEMTEGDIRPFLNLPFPVLILDTYYDTLQADFVLINNHQGSFEATSYLIRKTKKQPGYLRSSYSIHNFDERTDGFYHAVRANGMSASKSIVHSLTPSIDGAYCDMLEILKNKDPLADCYFADNDLIAIGAIKALKEMGYAVPADISVVGFDNLPMSTVIEPSLTTINVPKQYLGEFAVHRLVDRMENPNAMPVKIELSTSLVKRRSVASK